MKQGYSGKLGRLTPLLDKDGHPLYKSGLLWYRTPLFDFKANRGNPCVYTDAYGTQYMPDHHFDTDGGSIPPSTRIIPFAHLDPWNFPRAYPLHDGAYQYGGLYIKYADETTFKFRPMTRKQVDEALGDWLYYDDATWWDRRVILNGVALGSWTVWGDGKAVLQKVERVKGKIDVYDRSGFIIENNNRRNTKWEEND